MVQEASVAISHSPQHEASAASAIRGSASKTEKVLSGFLHPVLGLYCQVFHLQGKTERDRHSDSA